MAWPLSHPGSRWQRVCAALRRRLPRPGRRSTAFPGAATWRRDPLSHPALQAMTQRELGDLPFDPRSVAEE